MILQRQLKERLILTPPKKAIRLVAGADCAFQPDSDRLVAAVVLMRLPGLEIVETAVAIRPAPFPYVPGLLSFREGPALLAAFARLKRRPDAILIDGHGIAHPRGFGLAAHIGMWLDLPSVGCAKRRFVGTSRMPGPKIGDASPIRHEGRTVGFAIRTREKANPVFVSPGQRADLDFARRLVLDCVRGHRLPEPTRLADALAEASKPKRKRRR